VKSLLTCVTKQVRLILQPAALSLAAIIILFQKSISKLVNLKVRFQQLSLFYRTLVVQGSSCYDQTLAHLLRFFLESVYSQDYENWEKITEETDSYREDNHANARIFFRCHRTTGLIEMVVDDVVD